MPANQPETTMRSRALDLITLLATVGCLAGLYMSGRGRLDHHSLATSLLTLISGIVLLGVVFYSSTVRRLQMGVLLSMVGMLVSALGLIEAASWEGAHF